MFQISIDWIEFTIPAETPVGDTVAELCYYLESDFKDVGHGALGYENMAIGSGQAAIMTSERRPEHHVRLPGQWCRAIGFVLCTALLAWVLEHEGHFTRLDLAGDDYSKSVSSQDIAIACERGELVTHCHDASRIYGLRGKPQDGVYVGARTSRRRLRVYDKDKESDGEIDAIRWELQLRDEAADHAAKLVLNKPIQEAYTSILVGVADFREASKSNSSRRPRTAWFRDLVQDIKKAALALPQSLKTIEKIEGWLRKQVAPSLAAVMAASGGDIDSIIEIANEGRKRWKPAHRIAIEEAINKRNRSRHKDNNGLESEADGLHT